MTFYFRPRWGEVAIFHAKGYTAWANVGIAHRSWFFGFIRFKCTDAVIGAEQSE